MYMKARKAGCSPFSIHGLGQATRKMPLPVSKVRMTGGTPLKLFSEVLHIPWAEALNTFDGIYLSWDIALWSKKETFHGCVLACGV